MRLKRAKLNYDPLIYSFITRNNGHLMYILTLCLGLGIGFRSMFRFSLTSIQYKLIMILLNKGF